MGRQTDSTGPRNVTRRTPGSTRWLAGLAAAGLLLSLLAGCDALRGPSGLVSAGRAALTAGNAQSAISYAKHAIEKDPSLPAARFLLIDAALAQNDLETVGEQLDKVRGNGAANAELLPREWAYLRARNDFDGLARSVAAAPADVPEALRRRYEGLADLGLNRPQPAIAAFRRALELDPSDIDGITGLAQALFASGDRDGAVTFLRQSAARAPNSARLALSLGQALRATGQIKDAEESLKRAASLSSPTGESMTWLLATANVAEIALSQARYKDADAAVASLVKGAPHVVATRLLQARLALGEHRLDDAARYAQSVVSAAPQDVQGRMLLAYVTYAQGYLQQAESALDLVLADHPDYAPARKLLAEIQLTGNRADVAKRTLEPLLGPAADGETLALAGRIATASGETTEADGYFSRAIDGAGASEALKLKIAAQYLTNGKRDRAVAILSTMPGGSELGERRDLLLALAESANDPPDVARGKIDAVAAKYPDDASLQRSVALLHAARGDADAGRDRLLAWLKNHPEDVASYLVLGRIESAAHRYDEADHALREVVKREPKNVQALIELAAIAMLRNDPDAAVKLLESARAADPKAVEPRLSLARLYLARPVGAAQGLDLAQAPLREALAAAPRRVDVLILSAVAEKRAGHDAEAERILKDALTADAQSASLWLSLGELQSVDEHWEEARDSFKKALALQPGWLPAVKALAAVDVRRGEYGDALDATYKAREIGGLSASESREQRAGALLLEGDVHATAAQHEPAKAKESWLLAAQSYAKSFDTSPSFAAAARLLRARAVAGLADPDGPLSRWLGLHPGDVLARGTLANYYAARNDRPKAIALYEAGLALTPTQAPLLNNLAWLYFEARDPRALETARKAVQYSQRQAPILDTLGWILTQQDKAAEGLTYLAEAHKAQPANPELGYHYAVANLKSGHAADGRAALDAVLKEARPFPARAEAEALKARLESGQAP